MSFTQENETQIKKCNGCEKRCEFGTVVDDFTVTQDGMTLHYEVIYPTLAGKTIKSYLDRFGKRCHSGKEIVNGKILPTMQDATPEWRQMITDTQLEEAYEIAKLCDHYKTR